MVMRIRGSSVVATSAAGPQGNDWGSCIEGRIVGNSIAGTQVGNYAHPYKLPFARSGDGLVPLGDFAGMHPASEGQAKRLLGGEKLDVRDCVGLAERARADGLWVDN